MTAKITPGVTFANNPGNPKTIHDDLPFVGGKVGSADEATFRGFCAKAGIDGAHSLGWISLVAKYAAHLAAIAKVGADKAIAEFLRGAS